MKALFSRYGGNIIVFGKGKAGHLDLPEDQSLDNMLDNCSLNPVPTVFYLTSFVKQPAFMGNYRFLPKDVFLLGEMEHEFMDVSLQYSLRTRSKIYIGTHEYPNVYSVFIRTDFSVLKGIWDLDLDERNPGYDYVLTFFVRGLKEEADNLRRSQEKIEMIMILLAHHMGLDYSEVFFTPSKTWLGKLVRPEFPRFLKEFIEKGPSEEDLKGILQEYLGKLSDRMEL